MMSCFVCFSSKGYRILLPGDRKSWTGWVSTDSNYNM